MKLVAADNNLVVGDEETCPLRIRVKILPRADPSKWIEGKLRKPRVWIYLYPMKAIELSSIRFRSNAEVSTRIDFEEGWSLSILGNSRVAETERIKVVKLLNEAQIFVKNLNHMEEIDLIRLINTKSAYAPMRSIVSMSLYAIRNNCSRTSLSLAFTKPCTLERIARNLCVLRVPAGTLILVSEVYPYNILTRLVHQMLFPCEIPIVLRDPCTLALSCSCNGRCFELALWNSCFRNINSFICLEKKDVLRRVELNGLVFKISSRCIRIPMDPDSVIDIRLCIE